MGCSDLEKFQPIKKAPLVRFLSNLGAIFGYLIILLAEFLLQHFLD